jgi:hypothetical protein
MSQGPHVTVPCTAVNIRFFTHRFEFAGNLTSNILFAHWSSGGAAEDNTTSCEDCNCTVYPLTCLPIKTAQVQIW